jgi:hypothetical protein
LLLEIVIFCKEQYAEFLSMYQPAQTIKPLSYVGRRVVKLYLNVELSENISFGQLTDLMVALLLAALLQQVIVRLFLPGNGSQQEESCFHQSRGDIV